MLENKLISIIIPVYNVSTYIDDCMKSITAQTYSNIEIVLIDDGSTDDSGKKCDAWAETDSRVVVLHKNNAGVSAARNDGLRVAKGEYISFVDSDDIIKNTYIEYLYDLLVNNGTDISICNFVKKQRSESRYSDFQDVDETAFYVYDTEEAMKNLLYKRHYTGYAVVKLYKREVINSIYFQEFLSIGEDFDFVFRVMQNAKSVVYGNSIQYIYIQNATSAMHSKNWKKIESSWNYTNKELADIDKDSYLYGPYMTYKYVGGLSFYSHSFGWEESKEFKKKLLTDIKPMAKVVLKNKESKMVHRCFALGGVVSVMFTAKLLKLMVYVQEKLGVGLKKPI